EFRRVLFRSHLPISDTRTREPTDSSCSGLECPSLSPGQVEDGSRDTFTASRPRAAGAAMDDSANGDALEGGIPGPESMGSFHDRDRTGDTFGTTNED